MLNDFPNMTVLVTGGTKGIGRASVQGFVDVGAKVYGTYFWGDNLEELSQHFSQYPTPPTFFRADVRDFAATEKLINAIADERDRIDIVVANAAFAPQFNGCFRFRELIDSIEHNAWSLVMYLECIKLRFGQYPRYVVAITSEGHRSCHIPGYDYVAASKAVLEALAKYISARGDIIINCISPGVVDTEAFELVFGRRARDLLRRFAAELIVPPEAVGQMCVALCSGWMDAVRGQVIIADNGKMFVDTFASWIDVIDAHFVEK